MELVLEKIENAQVSTSQGRFNAIRRGYIKGIDNTAPGYTLLGTALAVLPAYLSAYPDPRYNARLVRHLVDAVKGSNTRADVTLMYEGPNFAHGLASFVLERSFSLMDVEAQFHPATNEQFKLRWAPTGKRKVTDVATLRFRTPVQRLVASGFFYGEPPSNLSSAYGTVNSTPWRGYPKGYWLLDEMSERTETRGNSYNVRYGFSTKMKEDWSIYQGLRDSSTGRWLPISAGSLATVRGLPYAYNVISGFTGVNPSYDGIIRVGPYDLTNFNSIFGF